MVMVMMVTANAPARLARVLFLARALVECEIALLRASAWPAPLVMRVVLSEVNIRRYRNAHVVTKESFFDWQQSRDNLIIGIFLFAYNSASFLSVLATNVILLALCILRPNMDLPLMLNVVKTK